MPNEDISSSSNIGETGGSQFGSPDALNSPVPEADRSPAANFGDLAKGLPSLDVPEAQQPSPQFQGNLVSTLPSGQQVQGNVQTFADDELKNMKDRFVLGMTRTLKESSGYLENKFGKDNVTYDAKGRLYFKRNKGDTFIPVDKDAPGFAGGLSIQDFADMLPAIGEAAFQGLGEASTAAGGAMLGGMVGGPPGAVIGAGAGLIAGLAGMPAATIKYKEYLLKEFGVKLDPEQTFMSQWVPQATMNAGLAGAGVLAGKALNAGGGLLASLRGGDKSLIKIAAIKQNIKDVLSGLGYSGESSADVASSIMGKEGRLTKILDQSGEKLGVMKDEAQKALNYAPVSLDETLTTMKDTLSKNGTIFKPNGDALRVGESFEFSPGNKVTQDAGRDYFGMPNGSKVADNMSTRYNDLLGKQRAGGGVQFNELEDALQSFGSMAQFEGVPANARLDEALKGIRNGMTKDRNNYIAVASAHPNPNSSITSQELQGLREHVQGVFDDYSTKKDVIDTFKHRYNQVVSDEKFNKTIINAYDPEDLKGLKDLLGEDSTEWKNLVSDYYNNVMESATNPRSGVLEPDRMLKEFVKMTKEKRDVLGFTDKFVGNLRQESNKFRESYLASIDKKAGKPLNIVEYVTAKLSGPLKVANMQYQAIGRMFNNDVRLADYMLDEGFLKMSQKAQFKEEAIELTKKINEGKRAGIYGIRDSVSNAVKLSGVSGASKLIDTALSADKNVKQASQLISEDPSRQVIEFTEPMQVQPKQ